MTFAGYIFQIFSSQHFFLKIRKMLFNKKDYYKYMDI